MVRADLTSYEDEHRHPANRLLHAIGIPVVVASLPIVFWSWKWALALHVAGWTILWAGHAIEGNLPASWKNPLVAFVAPIWWLRRAIDLIRRRG
ncbi:MAG: DUF962 domain-containing protein [Planctomycetes bacterium]|nr:DUF962 domain-containing protein [Planctomycetota bacterium]